MYRKAETHTDFQCLEWDSNRWQTPTFEEAKTVHALHYAATVFGKVMRILTWNMLQKGKIQLNRQIKAKSCAHRRDSHAMQATCDTARRRRTITKQICKYDCCQHVCSLAMGWMTEIRCPRHLSVIHNVHIDSEVAHPFVWSWGTDDECNWSLAPKRLHGAMLQYGTNLRLPQHYSPLMTAVCKTDITGWPHRTMGLKSISLTCGSHVTGAPKRGAGTAGAQRRNELDWTNSTNKNWIYNGKNRWNVKWACITTPSHTSIPNMVKTTQLAQWRRFLLEKLIVAQLVKKVQVYYESRSCITVFRKAAALSARQSGRWEFLLVRIC